VAALLEAGADPSILCPGGNLEGEDPDDPFYKRSPMGNVLATGAEPTLIEALVAHGARAPSLERAASGQMFYTSPSGKRQELRDMRSLLRAGRTVTDMRSRPPPPGVCLDSRLDKYLCGACKRPPALGEKLLKCGRCRAVTYCNKECQKADWSQHKAACSSPA
jgi:hypothetical protein